MKLLKGLLCLIIVLLSAFSICLAICVFVPGVTPVLSGAVQLAKYGMDMEALVQNGGSGAGMPPITESMDGAQLGTISVITRSPETAVPKQQEEVYTAPDVSALAVPSELVEKTGYLPVREENEQLGETEAEQIRNKYTYGETGEGLVFDELFYPYYGMLDEDQKKVYRQIYANANAVNGSFNPVAAVSMQGLKEVFMAVFNDHPELFWLESAYKGKFSSRGECVEITLSFYDLIDDLETEKRKFEDQTQEILVHAQGLGSAYEQEQYIHDALLDRVDYDLHAAYNQSAYSALVRGSSVCAGYARAFQYLMMETGIPCYYCTGYAGEDHAWNIVALENEFYNVDTTWDDGKKDRYPYFNKTDRDFSATHLRRDLSVDLPPCNGTAYAGSEGSQASEAEGRSLSEAGFTEEQVLGSLEDYFMDCYTKLMELNGSGEFQNVVAQEELLQQIEGIYDSNQYLEAYLGSVLSAFGAEGYEIRIEAEPLEQGRFLMHHSVLFR